MTSVQLLFTRIPLKVLLEVLTYKAVEVMSHCTSSNTLCSSKTNIRTNTTRFSQKRITFSQRN